MHEKFFYISKNKINGKGVIITAGNVGGKVDFVKWITDKCQAGIRPADVTAQYVVVGTKNYRVFMEPLGNGCSVITVLGL
jgi:hypothetical protein